VRSEIARVAGDNIRTSLATTDLGGDLSAAESLAMQLTSGPSARRAQLLADELDETLAPSIDEEIQALQALHARDAPSEAILPRAIARGWGRFEVLEQQWDSRGTAQRSPPQVAADSAQLAGIFDPLIASTRTLAHREAADAHAGEAAAQSSYQSNLWVIVLVAGLTLLAGLASGVWLVSSVARRVREYSRFATRVAAGEVPGQLTPHGNDELTDLGRALRNMVGHQADDHRYREAQDEFAETLQMTETEHEAHDLLKRHLERTIPAAEVIVLNGNNSADRLQATTARAATDALTGLPNKRSVEDSLKRMVANAARPATPLSAIVLDLDHFKQINDTYGHGSGDDVLAAAGAALKASIRAADFAGRFGGEEFIVLLSATDRDSALVAAEKIRHAIAAIDVPTVSRAITASLGVATFPDDATDGVTLMRGADRALYTAKRNGRNRIETVATTSDGPADAEGRRPRETDTGLLPV
jgi:diguanylate cyclase (GGDEF)-like protein